MPVQGIERVRRNLKIKIGKVDGEKTEAALYAVLAEGAASAATMTPIDTSTLINSQYAPKISKTGTGGMTGNVGYTARYAFAVHNASGKLKGQPRADFGKTSNRSDVGPQIPRGFGGGSGQGTYWSPNAEPGFLTKGFKEIMPIIPKILKRIYGV